MKKIVLLFSLLLTIILSTSINIASANEYIIGKGDSLSIRVWGEPELSAEVVVRPDGKISLPNIGDMTAAGITPRSLRSRVANALKEILFNPIVSISVNTFPANSMIVYGPGITSTVLPLQGKTTLLHVLSNIKPSFTADLANAYIERNGEKVASNFEEVFTSGVGELASFELLANDRLFIPKKENSFVFVEGEVNNPTSLPYTHNMTILEAIHSAGGFTKFADPNDTIITRMVNGKVERINVNLSDLIEDGDLSQNITLRSGDLIVIDSSWF